MHCNGKCQMAKKIREQEEKEQKRGYELKEAISLYVPAKKIQLRLSKPAIGVLSFNLYHNTLDELKFSPSIFHPPC